jgi:hypothetical protein
VSHVRDSGHTDVVRLMKVWKVRSALAIKTFVLELVAVSLADDASGDSIRSRLEHVWTQLRDHIDDVKIEDPANPTGNDLSGVFGDAERNALSGASTIALDLIGDGKWSDVFGVDPDAPEDQPEATSLVEAKDASHQTPPPWPIRSATRPVAIRCWVHEPRGGRFEIAHRAGLVLAGRDLEFRAATDVPHPYQVYWQVVNTGEHARQDRALRGDDFFQAKNKDRKAPSSDPLVTWECTKYTGVHWIECFVVKDGSLAARGRFDVSIVNREFRGHRPPPPRHRRWR